MTFFKSKIKYPKGTTHPPLPVRKNGKTYFPTGKFKGVYHTVELENAAKNHRANIELFEGLVFEEATDEFKDYINYFYKQKKEAQTRVQKFIAKLNLNSFYGR